MVQVTAERVGRARNVRGLAPAHLQLAGHADHQLGGEGAAVGGLVQLQRLRCRVEGARGPVPRVRGAGRRHGRRRYGIRAQVRRARRAVADAGDGRRERGCERLGHAELGRAMG